LALEALAAGQFWVLIKSVWRKYILSLDLNTDSESTLIIVSGNEFQTVVLEQSKAHLAQPCSKKNSFTTFIKPPLATARAA